MKMFVDNNNIIHFDNNTTKRLDSYFTKISTISFFGIDDIEIRFYLHLYFRQKFCLSSLIRLPVDNLDYELKKLNNNIETILSELDVEKVNMIHQSFNEESFTNFNYNNFENLHILINLFDFCEYTKYIKNLNTDLINLKGLTIIYNMKTKTCKIFNKHNQKLKIKILVCDEDNTESDLLYNVSINHKIKILHYIAYKQETLQLLVNSIEKHILSN